MAEKDINKIIIGEDTYNFRDNSIPEWAKEANKPSYSASDVGAVPTTRTVNGKLLSSNITLNASDVGALPIDTNIPVIQYIANESLMPETPTEGVLYLIGEQPLISFTIDGISYQAVEGMTWGEWVESEYNNDFYTNGQYIIKNETRFHLVAMSGTVMVLSDIISEIDYVIVERNTGGSD